MYTAPQLVYIGRSHTETLGSGLSPSQEQSGWTPTMKYKETPGETNGIMDSSGVLDSGTHGDDD
jgi:hypothetical protein